MCFLIIFLTIFKYKTCDAQTNGVGKHVYLYKKYLLFNLLKFTATINCVYSRGRPVIMKPPTKYFLLTSIMRNSCLIIITSYDK